MTFDAADSATWPHALTADQVAAIYQRPVGGLKKAVQRGHFLPTPVLDLRTRAYAKPLRWRKADVVRHLGLDAAPASLRRAG